MNDTVEGMRQSMVKADIKYISSNPLTYFNKWTRGTNAEGRPHNVLGGKAAVLKLTVTLLVIVAC